MAVWNQACKCMKFSCSFNQFSGLRGFRGQAFPSSHLYQNSLHSGCVIFEYLPVEKSALIVHTVANVYGFWNVFLLFTCAFFSSKCLLVSFYYSRASIIWTVRLTVLLEYFVSKCMFYKSSVCSIRVVDYNLYINGLHLSEHFLWWKWHKGVRIMEVLLYLILIIRTLHSLIICVINMYLDAMDLNSFGALPTWQESHWFLWYPRVFFSRLVQNSVMRLFFLQNFAIFFVKLRY